MRHWYICDCDGNCRSCRRRRQEPTAGGQAKRPGPNGCRKAGHRCDFSRCGLFAQGCGGNSRA